MNVVVVVATRHDSPSERARRFTESWWKWALPGADVTAVGMGRNRASAMNASVDVGSSLGADVVVMADSGVFFAPVTEVLDAVHGAAETGGLHVLSSHLRELDEGDTATLLDGGSVEVDGPSRHLPCGFAVTASGYWGLGGSDERLPSTGTDVLVDSAECLGRLYCHGAVGFSLWPGTYDTAADDPSLAARYLSASGNKFAMQQLIDERVLNGGHGLLWSPWAL